MMSETNSDAVFEPVVKTADMSKEMQQSIFDLTVTVLKDSKKNVEIASNLKKQLDKLYGSTWHCIVGKNFGSFVSHESGNFIYFYVDNLAFLCFKTA